MGKTAAFKLRCRDGHWEWSRFIPVCLGASSWGLAVTCAYGDHWLAPLDDGTLTTRSQPYAWPTVEEAEAARDRWEAQESATST